MATTGCYFGEELGQLVLIGYLWKMYCVGENMLANQLMVNLNVLGLLMKNWIVSNLHGTSIVNIEWSETKDRNNKLTKKMSKPNHLICRGHRSVFNFSRRF